MLNFNQSLTNHYITAPSVFIQKQGHKKEGFICKKCDHSITRMSIKNGRKCYECKACWYINARQSYIDYKVRKINTYKNRCIKNKNYIDKVFIKMIYKERDELNKKGNIKYEIDHIIPLCNKEISGLHTFQNLRIIPKIENCSKNNIRDFELETNYNIKSRTHLLYNAALKEFKSIKDFNIFCKNNKKFLDNLFIYLKDYQIS